jgi:hypothetical protein
MHGMFPLWLNVQIQTWTTTINLHSDVFQYCSVRHRRRNDDHLALNTLPIFAALCLVGAGLVIGAFGSGGGLGSGGAGRRQGWGRSFRSRNR